MNKRNILFIQGRPSAHPIHAAYGNACAERTYFEDEYIRWHDNPFASKFRRYSSWLLNALFFLFKRERVLFTECVRMPALLAKLFSFGHKQVISLMADESLYFLSTSRYPALTNKAVRYYFRHVDALICVGEFQYQLATEITKDSKTKLYKLYNGLTKQRHQQLSEVTPDLNSKKILFISNGPGSWRTWYKGLDLIIAAVLKARTEDSSISLQIVGEWDENEIKTLLQAVPVDQQQYFVFHGTADIRVHLAQSMLYLHCARGDSFPTSVLESMSAGLIPVISHAMGTQELVKALDPSLIVNLDAKQIAQKILSVLAWDADKKKQFSAQSRMIARQYSHESALVQLESIINDFAGEQ